MSSKERIAFARSGGLARAKKLSKKQRAYIARKAANARWAKYAKEKALETASL